MTPEEIKLYTQKLARKIENYQNQVIEINARCAEITMVIEDLLRMVEKTKSTNENP